MCALQRMLCTILVVASFIVHAPALWAQTGSLRVTVPSPTAASLGKFGDVPVNLYTGVPDISIPLFTVKGRTLELPITLRYHASGIRVEEIGGWAGLGWALEAGGVITRTVRGVVDEKPGGYYHTGNVFYDNGNWPAPGLNLIRNIREGFVDGEPDRFFFSFAGRSGQFVMGPISTGPVIRDYRSVPHQKLRIVPTFTAGEIASWEITTEDGTRYIFAAAETTTDHSLVTVDNASPEPPNWGEAHHSSWHLTEIRSPGGDTIKLYYSSYTVHHQPITHEERFDQRIFVNPSECVPYQHTIRSDYQLEALRLDSIKAAAHTVRFGTTLRSDALSAWTGQPQEPRLDHISISTPGGKEIRRFQFEHDYYAGNRLRLTNVYEIGSGGDTLPPYTFTYDNQRLPSRTSYAQDHWGFYNGKNANNTLIPGMKGLNGLHLSGADRTPDPAFMKAGILTRITYPTGGYNEFVYEANDYGAIGKSGSLPIAEGPEQSVTAQSFQRGPDDIQTFTIGGAQTVTVKVSVDQDPSGCEFQEEPPCPTAEIVGKGILSAGTLYMDFAPGTYTLRAASNGSDGYVSVTVTWRDRGPTKKKTAGGLRIAEVRTVDAMGNTTIRGYQYTLQSDTARSSGVVNAEPAYGYGFQSPTCTFFSRSSMSKMPLGEGPPVGYSEVTVWHGVNGEYGKTRHTFRSARDVEDDVIGAGVWPFATRTSYEWMRGQQTSVTEYNAAGQIQQRTASTYAFRDDSATVRKFRGMSIHTFTSGEFASYFAYQPFEVISAWVHPESDTTVIYNETGGSSISTVKKYTYGNPEHLQLTQITETNSDGTERITRLKYPADYASGSGNAEAAALTAMKGSAHMHSQVIERWIAEKKKDSGEKIVQAELTTFKEFAPGKILPFQRYILNRPVAP